MLVVVLAVLTVWLEPTRVVWGWLRGEAFYQGRPTSYWAERIRPWKVPDDWGVLEAQFDRDASKEQPRSRHSSQPDVQGRQRVHTRGWLAVELAPHEGPIRQWFQRWLRLPDIQWPTILNGDLDAAPVLTELLDHPERSVRDWAERGLRRIESGERGPLLRIAVESPI